MMGVTIYKRGKVWWISVSRDGAQERWSLKTTDRQIAAKAARIYEQRLASGEKLRQPRPDSPTFAAYSAAWLERKATSRRKATVDGYRMTVTEVSKVLGAVPVIEVTRIHARAVAEALAAGGKGRRSRESVLRYLAYLQSLFSDAAENLRDSAGRRLIAENPFANATRLVDGLLERADASARNPDRDPKPYSDDELAAIEGAAAVQLDAADWLKILFGLDAGLRSSEVFGLHRADLELEQQWSWVRRRVSRGEVGPPKTKRSRRRVPLTDRVVVATRAHVLEKGLASAALFPPRMRGGLLGYEDAKRFGGRYVAMLRAAGVEPGEHPFHRLRHTWVSRLLASGVAPYLVSKWAGHRSTAFTEEHYAEWMPGSTHREQVNRPQSNLSTISAQPNSRSEENEV